MVERNFTTSPKEIAPELRAYAREAYTPEVLTALVAIRLASEFIATRNAKPLQLSDVNALPRAELLQRGQAALAYLESRAQQSTFFDNHIVIHGPWPASGKTDIAIQLVNALSFGPTEHHANFEFAAKEHVELTIPKVYARDLRTRGDVDTFVLTKLAETLSILYRAHKRPNSEHIVVGGITQRLGALAAYLGLFDRKSDGSLIVPENWEKLQLLSATEPYALVFVDAPLDACIRRAGDQAIAHIQERNPNRKTVITESEVQQEHAYAKRQAAFAHAAVIREFTIAVMLKMQKYSVETLKTPLPLYYLLNQGNGNQCNDSQILDAPDGFIVCANLQDLAAQLKEGFNPTKQDIQFCRIERAMGGPSLVPQISDRRRTV